MAYNNFNTLWHYQDLRASSYPIRPPLQRPLALGQETMVQSHLNPDHLPLSGRVCAPPEDDGPALPVRQRVLDSAPGADKMLAYFH